MTVKLRLRQHTNPFSYRGHYEGPAPDTLLGGPPNELEIGPGLGELMIARAAEDPQVRLLGVEVRRAYTDICNEAIDVAQISNARVIYGEAKIDIPRLIADESLDFIYFMFADPWFKPRHHKRRVMNADFAVMLSKKLKLGAELHWATDNEALGEDILAYLQTVKTWSLVDEVPRTAALCGRGQHHGKKGDRIYGGRCLRQ